MVCFPFTFRRFLLRYSKEKQVYGFVWNVKCDASDSNFIKSSNFTTDIYFLYQILLH